MTHDQIIDAFLKQNPDIEAVDAFIFDVNGNTLGKRVPIDELKSVCKAGLNFSASALILDCRGIVQGPAGLGEADGDPDGTAFPKMETLVRVPWTKRPTAQLQFEMLEAHTRKPIWFDPRVILANIEARCRADGIHPVVACELEFYLLDPQRSEQGNLKPAAGYYGGGPSTVPSNLSLEILEEYDEVLSGIRDAAVVQNLPVSSAVAEYGVGQFEINLNHIGDPVTAADHAAMLRRMVKGVARKHGYEATFMPKPFGNQPGSGFHLHVSVTDEHGKNLFGADEKILRYALGGMQAMTTDSLGIFAPHFNAHRRFTSLFVPHNLGWSENNRSVAFRLPVSDAAGRRIEHRVAGADACPHLVIAAVLAAIHYGVTNKIEPTEPTIGESKESVRAFLSGLLLALSRLEQSELLAKYIPSNYLFAYCELKRGEYSDLIHQIMPAEIDFYL